MIPERDRDAHTSKRAENVHHVRSKGSNDGSRGFRGRKNARVTGIMKQQLEIAVLPSCNRSFSLYFFSLFIIYERIL